MCSLSFDLLVSLICLSGINGSEIHLGVQEEGRVDQSVWLVILSKLRHTKGFVYLAVWSSIYITKLMFDHFTNSSDNPSLLPTRVKADMFNRLKYHSIPFFFFLLKKRTEKCIKMGSESIIIFHFCLFPLSCIACKMYWYYKNKCICAIPSIFVCSIEAHSFCINSLSLRTWNPDQADF